MGGIESGSIPKLHEYITPQLKPLSPVELPYTIRVDEEFHKNPQPTVYDVRVAVDDPLREMMMKFLGNPAFSGMLREVGSLDDQLATIVQSGAFRAKVAQFPEAGPGSHHGRIGERSRRRCGWRRMEERR